MDSRPLQPQRTPPAPQPLRTPERSGRSPPSGPSVAWGRPRSERSALEDMKTQDWVREPQEPGRPGRRWSLDIDERRRLAELHGWQRQDGAGNPSDLTRIVAELVSKDVDRDVLLPHPERPAACPHAFRDFLARSAPSWTQTSSSPPS